MNMPLVNARNCVLLLTSVALLCLATYALGAQSPHSGSATFDPPAWAFPVQAGAAPPATGTDTGATATVPTSHVKFTVRQTRNRYDVADWNPEKHRAAPPIVMHGRKPAVMACGFCHLADGRGRPENAMIAVPCWSSWKTGIFSVFRSVSSM